MQNKSNETALRINVLFLPFQLIRFSVYVTFTPFAPSDLFTPFTDFIFTLRPFSFGSLLSWKKSVNLQKIHLNQQLLKIK